jgi:hypothetical protein
MLADLMNAPRDRVVSPDYEPRRGEKLLPDSPAGGTEVIEDRRVGMPEEKLAGDPHQSQRGSDYAR